MARAIVVNDGDMVEKAPEMVNNPGAGTVNARSQSMSREEQGTHASGSKADFQFREPNVEGAKRFLSQHKWPGGLQKALLKSVSKLPLRYFICDDSGSMLTNDGHKTMGSGPNTKVIGCTRWSELVSSLEFHAELAEAADAPSEFRLINLHKPLMLGMGDGNRKDIDELYEMFDAGPKGQTPICEHIRAVVADIKSMEKRLRDAKKQVAVIISTDGEATDGDISEAMKPLQDLPVWVVIKLCTDEDSIVEYWNNIDEELELEIDVLDDFTAEGQEVFDANPWLTYGEPVHRLREFGAVIKEFDLLDESLLSTEQMRVVAAMLVCDGNTRSLPHPEDNWNEYVSSLNRFLGSTDPVFDPLKRAILPWVNIPRMCTAYKQKNPLQSGACAIS